MASRAIRSRTPYMADNLDQDVIETMLVSENDRKADTQEKLMDKLEDGAETEASINHDVTFDLLDNPVLSEDPVNFDGNIESGEQ